MLISFFSIGQELQVICGSEPSEIEVVPPSYYSKALSPTDGGEQYVFAIVFYIIRDSDGTVSSSITVDEAQLMNVIYYLNTTFNEHNIFFKYRGYQYIDNSDYTVVEYNTNGTAYSNSRTNLVNYASTLPNFNSEALAMFIPYTTSYNETVYGSTTIFAFGDLPGINSFIPRSAFITNAGLKYTVSHEIGHNLNLYHTFHPHSGNTTASSCASNVERITRDPMATGYNADVAGDFVTDTNATYKLSASDINSSTCSFSNTSLTDCNGDLYSSNPPQIQNYMNYVLTWSCPPSVSFTPGQIVRARETIVASESADPNSNLGKLFLARDTVESLYEPYAIIPSIGDIANITSDGTKNGESIVCRYFFGNTYKYQKGFDYTFDMYGTIENVPTTQIPSYPDLGTFIINQLDPSYAHPFGFICYRGATICETESMQGGKIYTTTNLGNTNLSETTLTPDELEDPNLIDNLPNNTYNIIIQETATGETKTETIYKQD